MKKLVTDYLKKSYKPPGRDLHDWFNALSNFIHGNQLWKISSLIILNFVALLTMKKYSIATFFLLAILVLSLPTGFAFASEDDDRYDDDYKDDDRYDDDHDRYDDDYKDDDRYDDDHDRYDDDYKDDDRYDDSSELKSLREENQKLREEIKSLQEQLADMQQVLMEQIKVIMETLATIKSQ